jgi:hypothetical protein
MYQLWHRPTVTHLGMFFTMKDCFDFLAENPQWEKSDCYVKFFHHVETRNLG